MMENGEDHLLAKFSGCMQRWHVWFNWSSQKLYIAQHGRFGDSKKSPWKKQMHEIAKLVAS